jgi:hypothetical protein
MEGRILEKDVEFLEDLWWQSRSYGNGGEELRLGVGGVSMGIIDMRGFKFAVGPRLGVTISRHRPWSEFPWHFSMFLPEAFTTSEKRRKDRDSIRYLYSKSYSR